MLFKKVTYPQPPLRMSKRLNKQTPLCDCVIAVCVSVCLCDCVCERLYEYVACVCLGVCVCETVCDCV